MENRILESVPNQVADTIVIGLNGHETKTDLMAKIKEVLVRRDPSFFIGVISIRSLK